jgi:hypothetical protein
LDLLELIKNQIDTLPDSIRNTTKIPFVLTHIARAEHFLREAECIPDDQYLNDAVYRANQAFEAILKEAYKFFTDKDASRQNIFQIENYIIRKKLLNPRVTDLLKNYRTQWRNPSTHDYSLSFSQQEALVAVVSVQMFIKVLLNQIVAEIAFRNERDRAPEPGRMSHLTLEYQKLALIDKVASICIAFAKNIGRDKMQPLHNHIQIEGALNAFILNVDPTIEVKSQIRSSGQPISIKTRPDYFISFNQEMMILELKVGYKKNYEEDAIYRIIQYLTVFNPKQGLIFFIQPGENEYEFIKQERTIEKEKITIALVRPKMN